MAAVADEVAAVAPEALPTPSQKLGGAEVLGGAETRRGNSSKKPIAPPRNQDIAPPRLVRKKSRRWIEFKPGTVRKDGSRLYYPKWRRWLPGNEKKEWLGPVLDLEPMTEKEKNNYVNRKREASKRIKNRRNRSE